MRVGILERKEIQQYFKLDKRIVQIKKEIINIRESFYNQSMTTRVSDTDISLISLGFNPERNVIPMVDTISCKEETIERLGKKKRFFDKYLSSLDPGDRERLVQRYDGHLPETADTSDERIYDEILEIEDAVSFMYGLQVDTARGVEPGTTVSNVNQIAAMLGV